MFGKQSYFHKKIFSKGKKHRIAQKVQQRKNEKKKTTSACKNNNTGAIFEICI